MSTSSWGELKWGWMEGKREPQSQHLVSAERHRGDDRTVHVCEEHYNMFSIAVEFHDVVRAIHNTT